MNNFALICNQHKLQLSGIKMKKSLVILFISFLFSIAISSAQKDEVNKYLRLVAYGKIDEVRAVIPDLLAKYPNDPGIKLLHGTILDDAFLALDVYNGIIKNFPQSQWADHAYWRIIQFYAVLGDTAKAQAELANFRTLYPASSFIGPASDVVRSSVNLAKKNMKSTSSTLVTQVIKKDAPSPTKIETVQKPSDNVTATKNVAPINPDKLAESADLSDNKKNTKNETKNPDKLAPSTIDNNKNVKEKPIADKNPKVPTSINPTEETSDNTIKEPTFFGLQVGIYKEKNTAEAEKNKFLVRRLRTQVVDKEVSGVVMFAVVIGHYSSLESAEEGKKIVSIQCGCEPIIYVK